MSDYEALIKPRSDYEKLQIIINNEIKDNFSEFMYIFVNNFYNNFFVIKNKEYFLPSSIPLDKITENEIKKWDYNEALHKINKLIYIIYKYKLYKKNYHLSNLISDKHEETIILDVIFEYIKQYINKENIFIFNVENMNNKIHKDFINDIELLILAGANINALMLYHHNIQAIHLCAVYGFYDIIELLLHYGVNIDSLTILYNNNYILDYAKNNFNKIILDDSIRNNMVLFLKKNLKKIKIKK